MLGLSHGIDCAKKASDQQQLAAWQLPEFDIVTRCITTQRASNLFATLKVREASPSSLIAIR